jgi:type I restriction enzyme S subunit
MPEALREGKSAMSSAENEISLLREYRIRLVADVVTGKLDVREAAARLPDETEEAESLNEADAAAEDDDNAEGVDLDTVTDEVEA